MTTENTSLNAKDIDLLILDQTPSEKTWEVPAHGDKGPVTMSLRLPDVRITDSAGRYIVVSPEQAELIGSKLADLACWLHYRDPS
ncbi:hypothetical protein [Longimycelium tulufanense]|nr:hypothetical protein [Longimycelium tulufanense]